MWVIRALRRKEKQRELYASERVIIEGSRRRESLTFLLPIDAGKIIYTNR